LAKTVRRQTARLEYSIERLVKESYISRSMLYEEITVGQLIARKVGRRTVVRRSTRSVGCGYYRRSAHPTRAAKHQMNDEQLTELPLELFGD
jgi:hypothetical protein